MFKFTRRFDDAKTPFTFFARWFGFIAILSLTWVGVLIWAIIKFINWLTA